MNSIYDMNSIINRILWLINVKSILEQFNINFKFDINNIYQLNNNFVYRNNKEVFFFYNNTALFILERGNISKTDDFIYFYDCVLKLLNIDEIEDLNRLTIGSKNIFLLKNILKYCKPPLNKDITFKEIKFICEVLI